MAKGSKVDGLKELEATFKELGKVPQTVATKSARAGGNIALKASRKNAPVDSGALKDGLIIRKERKTKPGKAVYDVEIDPAKNNVFVKISKDGKRSYYPASQEYGFLTVNGGYVPGYRYMRRAIDENAAEIEKKILDTTATEVDKALRKGGGR